MSTAAATAPLKGFTAAAAALPAKAMVNHHDHVDVASDAGSIDVELPTAVSVASFGVPSPNGRSPSVSGSEAPTTATATTDHRARRQRAQRLLVRVPSTGAIVVVEGAALAFGKHKQRGKPLTLCAAFDCADPSTAVCPDAATCRLVHADTRDAPRFHPHYRTAAMLGQYPRMPRTGGPVDIADHATGDVTAVAPENVLLTRADVAAAPLRRCAHFSEGRCDRGSECEFAHVVAGAGSASPAPVTQARPAAAAAATSTTKRRNASKRQPAAAAAVPTPKAEPVAVTEQPTRPAVRPTRPASVPAGQHAMPAWHAMPTHCVPCVAAVLSSTWQQ